MIWLYVGMYYISGKDTWYINSLDFVFIPIAFIPSLSMVIWWLNVMRINSLVVMYLTNIKLFKVVTLNVLDPNEFYMQHIFKVEQQRRESVVKKVDITVETEMRIDPAESE